VRFKIYWDQGDIFNFLEIK